MFSSNVPKKQKPKNQIKGRLHVIMTIDSRDQINFQGKVEDLNTGQTQHFDSFLRLQQLLHNKMEELNSPQSTHQLRSWK